MNKQNAFARPEEKHWCLECSDWIDWNDLHQVTFRAGPGLSDVHFCSRHFKKLKDEDAFQSDVLVAGPFKPGDHVLVKGLLPGVVVFALPKQDRYLVEHESGAGPGGKDRIYYRADELEAAPRDERIGLPVVDAELGIKYEPPKERALTETDEELRQRIVNNRHLRGWLPWGRGYAEYLTGDALDETARVHGMSRIRAQVRLLPPALAVPEPENAKPTATETHELTCRLCGTEPAATFLRFCGPCWDVVGSSQVLLLAEELLSEQLSFGGGHDGPEALAACVQRVRLQLELVKRWERHMILLRGFGLGFAMTDKDAAF